VQNYQNEEPTCATEDGEELPAEVHISVRLVLGGLDPPEQRVVGRGWGRGGSRGHVNKREFLLPLHIGLVVVRFDALLLMSTLA